MERSSLAALVKDPPAMQETPVRLLGWEDPLEKGKNPDPSNLDLRIPWTEDLAGYGPWGRRVGHH